MKTGASLLKYTILYGALILPLTVCCIVAFCHSSILGFHKMNAFLRFLYLRRLGKNMTIYQSTAISDWHQVNMLPSVGKVLIKDPSVMHKE